MGGLLGYLYSLMFVVAPILIEKWGYAFFTSILFIGLLVSLIIGIHKAIGLKRVAETIRYLIDAIKKKTSKDITKILQT